MGRRVTLVVMVVVAVVEPKPTGLLAARSPEIAASWRCASSMETLPGWPASARPIRHDDGLCGTILKALREHQMSPDDTFLRQFWPRIKKALEYWIGQDSNSDGLIENTQHNTYDINYEGANTFVGALYLAALRAGEEMAREMGDVAFAKRCRAIFESGRQLSQDRLWNGEYFIQDVDLQAHAKHQYGEGCLSEHLFGQGWARQLKLGDIYPQEMVRSALRAVWKYNWAPDDSMDCWHNMLNCFPR